MSDLTCPTCGSPVRVHTGNEGTSSYEPLVDLAYTRRLEEVANHFDKHESGEWPLRPGVPCDTLTRYRASPRPDGEER